MDNLQFLLLLMGLMGVVAHLAWLGIAAGWRLARQEGRQAAGFAALAFGLLMLIGGPLALGELFQFARYNATVSAGLAALGAGVGVTVATWQRRNSSLRA